MKCPHCNTEIGLPSFHGDVGTIRAWGYCPECNGKITYHFSGKRIAWMTIPAALACWFAFPTLGDSVVLVFPLLVLLPAISLGKYLD
jgi:hypothetical protein